MCLQGRRLPLGQGVEQQPSIKAVYQAVRLIWQWLQGGLRRVVLCSLRVVHKLNTEAVGCVLICTLRLVGAQACSPLSVPTSARPIIRGAQLQDLCGLLRLTVERRYLSPRQ